MNNIQFLEKEAKRIEGKKRTPSRMKTLKKLWTKINKAKFVAKTPTLLSK